MVGKKLLLQIDTDDISEMLLAYCAIYRKVLLCKAFTPILNVLLKSIINVSMLSILISSWQGSTNLPA